MISAPHTPAPHSPALSRRSLGLGLGLALIAAPLLGLPQAAQAEVTTETARGPASLAQPASRPAVYDMAALDTILALGVTPAGTIDKVLVPFLDGYQSAAKVGTLFEPDLEALAGLAPDLVVIGGRSAAQYDALQPLGLPVLDMTIGEDMLGDTRARIGQYGALFDKQPEAEALTAAFDAKLVALRAAAEGKGKALVILTNGTKMSAFGRGSRFGWLHDVTGLPEAREGLSTDRHGNAISHEFIAETDPDWIFVADRSAAIGEAGEGAKAVLDNPLVNGTKAAKAGHIVYLDPAAMYISAGGYSSTLRLMDQLIAAMAE